MTKKKCYALLSNIMSQVIFGFAYLFVKAALKSVNDDTIKYLAFRFVTAFIALSFVFGLRFHKVSYHKKSFFIILLCGCLNPILSQIFETFSTIVVPTSMIGVYTSMIPVVMLLLAIPINREYPTRSQVLFVLVSVLGVFLVNAGGLSKNSISPFGFFLLVGLVVIIAASRVLVRRACVYFSPFEVVYMTTAMGAVWFSAASLAMHTADHTLSSFLAGVLSSQFIIPVLYMGIVSCAVAFLLMTYAAKELPIAVYASTGTLSTVIIIFVGVFFLDEAFYPSTIFGVAVILIGIIGISLSYARTNAKCNQPVKKQFKIGLPKRL